jgi:pSer/pThr/pTyr-binding forkhead associated (FHA) protein
MAPYFKDETKEATDTVMCDEPTDVIHLESLKPSGGETARSVEVVRQCVLRVVRGEGDGQEIKLGKTPIVAGRSSVADLFLSTSSASRKHFEVAPLRGGYVLRDLDSTNGTKVNHTRVAECRLSDGDIISVGTTQIAFFEETRLQRKER